MSWLEPPPTHGPDKSGCPSGIRGTGPFAISGRASGVNSPQKPAGSRPDSCCGGAGSCAIGVAANATTATNAITTCLTVTLHWRVLLNTFSLKTYFSTVPLLNFSTCALVALLYTNEANDEIPAAF